VNGMRILYLKIGMPCNGIIEKSGVGEKKSIWLIPYESRKPLISFKITPVEDTKYTISSAE
jgi:hypothetical protein